MIGIEDEVWSDFSDREKLFMFEKDFNTNYTSIFSPKSMNLLEDVHFDKIVSSTEKICEVI